MAEPDGDILTLEEVAAYLKAGKRTVYRLAASGEIPAFKLGGTWRFRRSELDQWIAALGWDPLLNRRGTTWRKLDRARQAAAQDAAGARALMLAEPSVIKRPVVHWVDGAITVGFDADAWRAHL